MRAYLLTADSVTELAGDRIFPGTIPQGKETPAIVYRVISTRPEHTIGTVTNLFHSRVEVACVAGSRELADELAKAARKSGLVGYRGTPSGITDTFINGVELDSGESQTEFAPSNGGPAFEYVTTFDFTIHFTEL
jgi:hypothetical protein